MCIFFKIIKKTSPLYLQKVVNAANANIANGFRLPHLGTRTLNYKASFFPASIHSWNKIITVEEKNSPSVNSFKSKLLKRIKGPKVNNFGLCYVREVKFINQLRLGLSLLSEHKCRHNFLDTPLPFCLCGGTEDTFHFLCECVFHSHFRNLLYQTITLVSGIDPNSLAMDACLKLLLYGDPSIPEDKNKTILSAVNSFILNTNRFAALLPQI